MIIIAMIVYVALRYWRGSKIGKSDIAMVALASLLLGAQCPKVVNVATFVGKLINSVWTWAAGLIGG